MLPSPLPRATIVKGDVGTHQTVELRGRVLQILDELVELLSNDISRSWLATIGVDRRGAREHEVGAASEALDNGHGGERQGASGSGAESSLSGSRVWQEGCDDEVLKRIQEARVSHQKPT